MSTIALPSTFADPKHFTMDLYANQGAFGSPFGGSEQVVDRLNDRWTASATIRARTKNEAGEIEGFIWSLRRQVNTVNLWHLGRPVPLGTLRGSPVTEGALQGADQIAIVGAAGYTLRQGDLVSAGGLLLAAALDCVADGTGRGVVKLANRLRKAIAPGAPVSWYRPTAPFRMIANTGVNFVPGYIEEVSFDFVEDPIP